MDKEAIFHLTYGLYLLTAREDGKDYGCIINTAVQVSDNPDRIAISLFKGHKTHEILKRTERFNVSVITKTAPFQLFRRFGMQSARDVDKFDGFTHMGRGTDMLPYLNRDCSAYLTGHVTDQIDLGSHTLFVARVIDGKVLNPDPPCTYAYYRSDIKPKPQPERQVPQWECTVCGYLYEGEEVPDDFICPLCKHGKEDFVKIQ